MAFRFGKICLFIRPLRQVAGRKFHLGVLSNNGINNNIPKEQELFTQKEISILNKTNPPAKVTVTEATDVVKVRAANSFTSNSIFFDDTISKFVNIMMKDGKKAVSRKIMEDMFFAIKKIQLQRYQKAADKSSVEIDPLKIFNQAMDNVQPVLGTQTIRKRGKNLQVPYPLPPNRRRFLAIKWFIESAKKMPGNDVRMSEKLSKVMVDAYKNEGAAVQRKIDYHKRAETNRALAHYRWW